MATPDDVRWMRRALRLAARGFTPPNPMVGCVLVKAGRIVGEGFHRMAGEPHAEVMALRAAGEAARGATAYVSLEPCRHYGRTPPCTAALIGAGVARVVAAVEDPNPLVAGQGLEDLRRAGIAVQTGLLTEPAAELNAAFFHYQRTGRPLVVLKAAMTLDGKIATRTGDSRWITGSRARAYVHRLRAQSGAVLVGIGTVLADDPLLTARLRGVSRQPLRIVLDTNLRIPLTSRLAVTARVSPVIVAAGTSAGADRVAAVEQLGIEVLRLPDCGGRVALGPLLETLGRRGIISVLVEGGGAIHASFLEGRFAHRLLWFISPKVVGGRDAITPVEGSGAASLSDALPLDRLTARRLGPDFMIECGPVYPPEGMPCDDSLQPSSPSSS